MSEIEKKWYVLRAVSGKESKVKEYLDADIKNSDLSEYVSQVLIPTEKVYQVRNGKKIVKERSYLPGYVLVEAALVGEVAHHLRNTPNVIGFLGGSENPVPLRQSEVNRILGTVDELQEGGEELNVPYTVGETVKVTVGPFSGFSGLIEDTKRAYAEKINPAKEFLSDKKGEICKSLIPIVPVRMVEAWMLADKELLKEEMGTRMSDEELGINRMPELYLDPKATIIQAIGKSNRTTTRRHRKDLDISELYASIGARLELEKLHLLPSYRQFVDEVREAYRQLGLLR